MARTERRRTIFTPFPFGRLIKDVFLQLTDYLQLNEKKQFRYSSHDIYESSFHFPIKLGLTQSTFDIVHGIALQIQSHAYAAHWFIQGINLCSAENCIDFPKILDKTNIGNQLKKITINDNSIGVFAILDAASKNGKIPELENLQYLMRYNVEDKTNKFFSGSISAFHTLPYLGMNMLHISLFGVPVSDISSLQFCTKLKTLSLDRSDILDLNVLVSCTKLEDISVTFCKRLLDIVGLQLCSSLTHANFGRTEINSINGLILSKDLQGI